MCDMYGEACFGKKKKKIFTNCLNCLIKVEVVFKMKTVYEGKLTMVGSPEKLDSVDVTESYDRKHS